jgi:hypothetical protein
MQRTQKQNKILHMLISKIGMPEDAKREMIISFTNGRTANSSEMNYHECQSMINTIKSIFQDEADKKRKKVISNLLQAGFTTPEGKADMHRINAWCRNQAFKKDLNGHSMLELSKLIYAAEKVKAHSLGKIGKERNNG